MFKHYLVGGAVAASLFPALAAGQTNFNPEMSLILQGAWVDRAGGERHITGFLPADSHGHGHGGDGPTRGFTLDQTELVMSANVDRYFRGYLNLAFIDEEVEVEEAWFQTLGLGHGFSVKGGRFLSGIGYQNELHPHAWDFYDTSLMYQALFGTHLIHDGLQAKWIAPLDTFLEFGVEAARGQNFPGTDNDKRGVGTWAAFAHIGDDVGTSHSWRAGLSHVRAKPEDRDGEVEDLWDDEADLALTGNSRAWIADFVWKWAPEGNPTQRNLTLQAEYFRRTERGEMECEDGACTGEEGDYRARQSGWYAQGVYQFMPRWRVGYRYDRLQSDSVDFGNLESWVTGSDYEPSRHTLMVDYSPSEFSRLRLQYARDKSMEDAADNQVILQYIFSLGAHGAHRF
jgi:hypothetical protein